jgi:L-asparaginase
LKQEKPNVLIIYTGGTIGMIQDVETGALKAFDFNHLNSQIPELNRLYVNLASESFEIPVDSSEMNPSHWGKLAKTVFENYAKFDGFVVLHGSDTMAYTASALSFMLQNLSKPIILTGSQLPIGTIRTDGKENLITAIEIAGAKDENNLAIIQEVAIYFEYSLYRGNRTSKVSASNFEAFMSPNYPELAVAGVNINYQLKEKYANTKTLELFSDFNTKVALLKIFPGFLPEIYEGLFDINNVKGIVIESFGAGNVPSNDTFKKLISDYINKGGIILNITQCNTGKVRQGKYETSAFFEKIGVIGGNDLTTESAMTKMMYLLGKYSDIGKIKNELKRNICGELSE